MTDLGKSIYPGSVVVNRHVNSPHNTYGPSKPVILLFLAIAKVSLCFSNTRFMCHMDGVAVNVCLSFPGLMQALWSLGRVSLSSEELGAGRFLTVGRIYLHARANDPTEAVLAFRSWFYSMMFRQSFSLRAQSKGNSPCVSRCQELPISMPPNIPLLLVCLAFSRSKPKLPAFRQKI